jgi:L-threonate 2-dehydrogenase
MAKRVGIVGIGIMGTAMMRNLAKDGFQVVGFDIAKAAMKRLSEAGGISASSPRNIAEQAEILITSLPSVDAFKRATTGQGGIASSNGTGQIVIECSTLPLEVKERGRAMLAEQGKILLDCPVSGTGAQAARKDLVVFGSGDQAPKEVLAGISRLQKYVGPFGHGSKMKFIANHLVTIHNLSTAETFVLAQRAGLDPALVLEVIRRQRGNLPDVPSARPDDGSGPIRRTHGHYDDSFEGHRHHQRIRRRSLLPDAALHRRSPVLLCCHRARPWQRGPALCAVLEKLAGIERKE